MNYKSKYLKYKLKYLITKKLLGGSNSDSDSNRPKSAPTTPYENKEARKLKVTNYPGDVGKKLGHAGDKTDILHELQAESMAQDYQHEISKPDNKSIKN